ncbi:uncharacterized protein Z520_10974 [Fonsecaea multimorphosa CBS 102226]|uniref:Velvet domain-containing protein n=1 Tax=Fonsecaea multimorphosa CBS 102226 TaxID=1442371 RepID=A0A0D2I815_9EURO|nr:uncharacterized protein Z520_10974 [Fonsecaea multimorphosa CBS 102226]KIX93331.1 hypothetical protein Z520_10974 [Fonsecaea multimorphosa CBS 102226]OAL18569.1 hypothetical protein AYO22_10546 [Fonsecaea multimorphosa]
MAANNKLPLTNNNMHTATNSNSNGGSSNMPPASPSHSSTADDESFYGLPEIPPISRIWGKYGFAVEIIQQPKRARMCGFGDKDRRPITPPLIAKLHIFDPETHKEIDYSKVVDLSKFILGVDLWDVYGTHEDNCVRNNTTSPSISSTITTPYPPVATGGLRSVQQLRPYDVTNLPSWRGARDPGSSSTPTSAPTSASSTYNNDSLEQRNPSYPYNNDMHYNGQHQNGYDNPSHRRTSPHEPNPSSAAPLRSARSSQDLGHLTPVRGEPSKNLIGQCHTSVQRLDDENKEVGLYFIFQDLSVRTEGWFRLKCALFCLAKLVMDDDDDSDPTSNELYQEAPCLASTFTLPFKVFSAKKFPGVVETTHLSRIFADQGIKIPIRRDGQRGKRRAEDDGDGANGDGEYEGEDGSEEPV